MPLALVILILNGYEKIKNSFFPRLAGVKASLPDDKALLAGDKASLAGDKATLAVEMSTFKRLAAGSIMCYVQANNITDLV